MNVPLVAVVISAQPRAKRENPGCRYAHPTATKTDPDGTSLVCAAEYSDAASGLLLALWHMYVRKAAAESAAPSGVSQGTSKREIRSCAIRDRPSAWQSGPSLCQQRPAPQRTRPCAQVLQVGAPARGWDTGRAPGSESRLAQTSHHCGKAVGDSH